MDSAYDIPDATDWLNTPLAALLELENALHCQICKEFYDTPMITSCSHTFCSKCIRTSLSADGKCPACRTADQANKLRNNWQLQEVVNTFLAARPQALKVARQEREEENRRRSSKRKRAVLESDDIAEAEPAGRTTRAKSRRIAASQGSQADVIEVGDSDGESDYESEQPPDDGLVECPLGCGKRMKIEAVEPHLDRCEDERKAESRSQSRTPINGFASARPSSRQATRPQDRIAELSYSMLRETALRKKLNELGIPGFGTKQLMVKRHIEWVNLWNANCDSNHPRSKRELLHDLDTWERTQGGRAPNGTMGSTVMRKDFDGQGWASKNKDEFSRLIADARRKKTSPAESGSPKEAADGEPSGAAMKQNDPDQTMDNAPSVTRENQDTQENYARPPAEEAPNTSVGPAPSAAGQMLASATGNEHHESQDVHLRTSSGAHDHPLLRKASSGDQHLSQENRESPCDLQSHLSTTPVKKVPMFAVPQEQVKDVELGGGGEMK